MEFFDVFEILKKWFLFIMEGCIFNELMVVMKIDFGMDVNFGVLICMLFDYLKIKNVELNYKYSVENIKCMKNGLWEVKVYDMNSGKIEYYIVKFVFIGGGGGSLFLF